MDLLVAKFGGTSVGDGSRIKKAAQSVVNEYMKGNQIVVVVSAVNKSTDELIGLSDDAVGAGLTDKQRAGIVAMGELTSVRLFSAAIQALSCISLLTRRLARRGWLTMFLLLTLRRRAARLTCLST